jgi:hypothetical protein
LEECGAKYGGTSWLFIVAPLLGYKKDKLFSSESHILERQLRQSGDGDNDAGFFLALIFYWTED